MFERSTQLLTDSEIWDAATQGLHIGGAGPINAALHHFPAEHNTPAHTTLELALDTDREGRVSLDLATARRTRDLLTAAIGRFEILAAAAGPQTGWEAPAGEFDAAAVLPAALAPPRAVS